MKPEPGPAGTRVIVRSVTKEDLPAVALLEKEVFPGDPWSEKLLREAAAHPDTLFLTAYETKAEGGEGERETCLAGYCVLRTVLDEGSIDNICVAPPYRRRGLARRLLTQAMHTARKMYGAETFTLEVRVSNAPARALYRTLGFTEEGIRPSYYPHPREDAVIYRKYRETV